MDFVEVMNLHRAVAEFCLNTLEDRPKLGVYDIQNREQGYILCIKTKSTSSNFVDFLKQLTQANKLN